MVLPLHSLWYNRRTFCPKESKTLLQRILTLTFVVVLLAACGSSPTPSPTATLPPTATPKPTLTPTPTPIPNSPAPNPTASWNAPAAFSDYPEAIRAYLNAGGSSESLATLLRNASSINDRLGSVQSMALIGDGTPQTIVSIFNPTSALSVPSGMLLVYGCAHRQAQLLYAAISTDSESMPQVVKAGNLIGAQRGGQIATLTSTCGAHTCFEALEVLGWNGQTFVSLMGSPLDLPAATYTFTQPAAGLAFEIEAQSGLIESTGAGPQRTEKQIWKWNGAQYVKVSSTRSPVEYRIQAVYEGDDAFKAGDFQPAIDWYTRVINDDTLKDWLTEIQYPRAHDRDTLTAYARFRLLLIGLLRGDANARDQLDQLTSDYPDGHPVHATQQMAQVFWQKYQATQNFMAACAVANAYANSGDNGQYLIVDDLNLFGYSNRTYTSDDMCPIK